MNEPYQVRIGARESIVPVRCHSPKRQLYKAPFGQISFLPSAQLRLASTEADNMRLLLVRDADARATI